jgi:hypothetical protein
MATTSNSNNSIFKRKKRKKITRRKPGEKPGKSYFSKDTQKSILEFQDEANPKKREIIYVENILPAFDSLVENLINVYGYKVMYETKKDLKSECLEFLFTTVGKFNGKAGTKAFSYFNVVAKNWLTIRSKKNAKAMKTYISSDNKETFTAEELTMYESYNVVPSYEEIVEANEANMFLSILTTELEKKAKTENEKLCLFAIKQVVNNLENIDILNKRAVLLYLREISGLSAKQLSSVLSSLKKHYKDIRKIKEN